VTNAKLKIAHCADSACSSAAVYTLGGAGTVFSYWLLTSVTVGADGLGLVSYYDNSDRVLKVAHCANTLCMPWVRRR
jgi:hypothetical protein